MFDPISTYRIQFHKGFSFNDFEAIIPYLQQLGIKTIYASPIFRSVPGSAHGYDVTNPNEINPEIGKLEKLEDISSKLKSAGMNWIQDIVPNHMALHSENGWLMDVLEHGQASIYSNYFDIDWEHPGFTGKLMVPILGASLEEAVARKDIILVINDGRPSVKCYDAILPLNNSGALKLNAVGGNVEKINDSQELLLQLLKEQYYTLTHWAETDKHINYRRFFTVNSLICLNTQNVATFDEYHKLIKTLCDRNIFQGLRVDHIDGLFDPGGYLNNLRALVGNDKYIVVEKILEEGEDLPHNWPIQGTTGYDFLGAVNNVFTNRKSKKALTQLYAKQTSEQGDFNEMLRDRKALILSGSMRGELENLYRLLLQLDIENKIGVKQIPGDLMKETIGEFLLQCPVYKYYGAPPLQSSELDAIKQVLAKVNERDDRYREGVDVLERVFLKNDDDTSQSAMANFYKRCMQFTGPLMAKGMEDTLMYNYNRFIGHNEVGDTPKTFGHSSNRFHEYMQNRQTIWPTSMNTTATHDTKRGEDARARLNAISDMPEEWAHAINNWRRTHEHAIDNNDTYFILQSITACHPMPGYNDDFEKRFKDYIQKALREAKVHTGWATPDKEYEKNVTSYIDLLLRNEDGFIASMGDLFTDIVDAGIINSLSQVLLRLTCPGMPDTYQGTELWDLSMVDPDNRRPVNYRRRSTWLNELKRMNTEVLQTHLWDTRYTGRIKLWLINTLLQERSLGHLTFDKGKYVALSVKGKYRDNILAYMRHDRNTAYIIVVPLYIAAIAKKQQVSVSNIDWKDTEIHLPGDAGQPWSNILTGKKIGGDTLIIKDLFTTLPIGILKSKMPDSGRRAGILMPVFSLPSSFGIGDFGPGTIKFVDFLADSGQRYWQLLPLNPTLAENNNSPYNSISAMALNSLFISPELLLNEGLLTKDDVEGSTLEQTKEINYPLCDNIKNRLSEKAYANSLSAGFRSLQTRFKLFCERQQYWLDDFALFVVIKRHHSGKPWHEWPSEYKMRDKKALDLFAEDNSEGLNMVKWQQFIADEQWQLLRGYCKRKDIELFGDLPFYVSYDSADVWASPELFKVDDHGKMTGNSGVPPDYFSKTGQLWNMPTYAWEELKKGNYAWWIKRLKRNLELFDIIRLDHFRAFEAYWEVPAKEVTAVNGNWIKGPGGHFFDIVSEELGGLPFVAEDLGYEMDEVYALREKIGLPGMKVLQFAWGATMPILPDTPHNYVTNCFVYTGTHDNNTTKGWYLQETNNDDKKRLEKYVRHKVKEKNIVDTLIRLAYSSVGRIVILPIQDVMGYGPDTRINTPGTTKGNWQWRIAPNAFSEEVRKNLLSLTKMYNR